MTLPSSGVITLEDIQAEFGGPTSPISLFNYYRGGTYVPDNANNAGVPTSGQIGLLDFYDAANVQITAPGLSASSTNGSGGSAYAQIQINADGTTSATVNPTGPTVTPDWADPASASIGDDYELRATLQSGTAPSGTALDTWLSMGSVRAWSQSANGGAESNSCVLLIEIRAAGDTVVISSDTSSVSATSTL